MGRLPQITLVGLLVASALAARPVAAQQDSGERVPVTVDYVSADGIYLPVGADQGLALGDTVPVYADSAAAAPAGRVVFTSVTRRRSVAQPVEPGLQIARGDVLYVPLGPVAEATAQQPGPTTPRPTVAAARRTFRSEEIGPRVSGRLSIDFDLRETRTSWSGDLFGDTRRRFATPTSRLSLTIADLPGGFTVRTNLRASYRYDDGVAGPPPTSIRAYEAVIVKSFDAAPVEVMLGRFSNPYESYSAYWDGLLLRVGGGRGPGIGVVAGFEPSLYDERPSTALPKLTGFADLSLRGDGWRYDTDVSVHYLRPKDGSEWSYAGWTQRISLGRLDISQRLRVDGGLDGRTPELGDIRVRASVDVAGPLGLHGGYGRSGNSLIAPGVRGDTLTDPFSLVPREEFSGGLSLTSRGTSLWVDVGQSRRMDDTAGRFVSGSSVLPLGGAQLLLSGRYWYRGDASSVSGAPALAFATGGMRWRVGYRFYRTDSSSAPITTSAADLRVSTSLLNAIRLTLGAEHQWGSNLSGDRVQIGFARSF